MSRISKNGTLSEQIFERAQLSASLRPLLISATFYWPLVYRPPPPSSYYGLNAPTQLAAEMARSEGRPEEVLRRRTVSRARRWSPPLPSAWRPGAYVPMPAKELLQLEREGAQHRSRGWRAKMGRLSGQRASKPRKLPDSAKLSDDGEGEGEMGKEEALWKANLPPSPLGIQGGGEPRLSMGSLKVASTKPAM